MMERQFLFLLNCCLLIFSSEGKEKRALNGLDLSSDELFLSQLDKAASSVDQSTYSVCRNGEWTNSNEQDNIHVSCHSVYEVCGTTLMYLNSAFNLSLNLRINNNNNGTDSGGSTTAEAYGYGSIMIVVISLLSLLGLFFVPCLNQKNPLGQLISRYLLTMLTAMGVSALLCSVMFELIPTAFHVGHAHGESHDHDDDDHHDHDHDHDDELSDSEIIWKASGIVAGVFIFYLLELVLQTFMDNAKKKKDKLKLDPEGQTVEGDKSPLIDGETNVTVRTYDQTFCQKVCSLKQVRPLAWIILIGDLLHNAADGITLGVAISQSLALGLSTAFAIGLHEIPHEIADFGILVKSGMHWFAALIFNFLSSLTAIVGFFIGVAISTNSTAAKEWLLAIAAGSFLYIALADLLPELRLDSFHSHDPDLTEQHEYTFFQKICHGFVICIGFLIAFAVLLLVTLNEEKLNDLF